MQTHHRSPEEIERLDLTRIRWKLSSEDPTTWTTETLDAAEREYRRFLALKKAFPAREFVPTKLVDEFWHQHILDTAAYATDCESIFGRFVHHYPYFGMHDAADAVNLAQAFHETQRAYAALFGEEPPQTAWARCKDHACHAPTSCACRTPGACKGE